jgi:hypothetical protein
VDKTTALYALAVSTFSANKVSHCAADTGAQLISFSQQPPVDFFNFPCFNDTSKNT